MVDKAFLKETARKYGADLVGVAPIERFKGYPPEGNPLSINPDAKSVIVMGFMIPRGALRGIEEGTAWQTMSAGDPSCDTIHPLIVIETTYFTVRWLESQGWEATPIFNYPLELRGKGVSVAPDRAAPDVLLNFDYSAYAAGLGEVGRGKFFLTPEYGVRQLFSAIITDAEIEPDPLFEGSLCENCNACIKACPARAYSENEYSFIESCGKKLEWNTLHIESCLVCRTGATKNPYCKTAEPWRVGAARGRACVAHLDKERKLKYKYALPFRENE